MATCTLRVGGEEETEFVSEVLTSLMGLDYLLFIEVAYYAARPQDPSFGSQKAYLIRCGLLDDAGKMSERVQNVIRSATQVVGLEVRKMNPYSDSQ